MDDMLKIAKQLGVDEKESRRLATLSKVLSNRIVAVILAFAVGVIVGAVFPNVKSITKTVYPYFTAEVTSGTGIARSRRRSLLILIHILGITSFIIGFALSSQLIFARTYIEYEYPPILYGVFAGKNR